MLLVIKHAEWHAKEGIGESKASLIPASPDTDTSPVSGRDGGPASEGSLDESPSRLDGIRGIDGRTVSGSPAGTVKMDIG
jgi:hypothetical protein